MTFLFFSSSRWEILGGAKRPQSYKAKGQNETRCDKFLKCLSVCRLLPEKKREPEHRPPPHLPGFYSVAESLTTAISHDKVFN